MNNHQSLKAEIDARGDNFSACIALGKELLSRQHYATNEVLEPFWQSIFLLLFSNKAIAARFLDQRKTGNPHQPT